LPFGAQGTQEIEYKIEVYYMVHQFLNDDIKNKIFRKQKGYVLVLIPI